MRPSTAITRSMDFKVPAKVETTSGTGVDSPNSLGLGVSLFVLINTLVGS